jgi:8-oxo-dGTP pyrophosphatase MutT (NUDIX family)
MKNSSGQKILEIKDMELHRIVTTVLIYTSDFKYLITKRAMHKKVHPGRWTIPGGGLHVDDYIHSKSSTKGIKQWYGVLQKVITREIKEEVNLKIGKPELLVDVATIRPDGVPLLILSYYAPYVSGKVKLDQDATEFAWITAKQAKDYDFIAGIAEEIRDIDKILKSRKK